jgi:septum formation protein
MEGLSMKWLANLEGYRLKLASRSPRRRQLMEQLGIPFEVMILPDREETFPPELKGKDVARYISAQKADFVKASLKPDDLVITADTIVCQNEEILGKPADEAEAEHMLRQLSGNTHTVYTGVALTALNYQASCVAETVVTFSTLSEEEINWYIAHYKPLDKAGAYGIQEWIGLVAVERIDGSFFNVMGLPVHTLYEALKRVPALVSL